MKLTMIWRSLLRSCGAAALLWTLSAQADAREPLVPGTGEKLPQVGDDFEDPNWTYIYNSPKASVFQDKQSRAPGGRSANGRWAEPTYRGQPDLIKRVPTPIGGIPGSEGSLLIRSMHTGIPGKPSGERQQDDLLAPLRSKLGGWAPVSWQPSCVVRVYMPPFEEWEQSTGTSFAFRGDCRANSLKEPGEKEEYWPGIFVQYEPRRKQGAKAHFVIRSDKMGRDLRGPDITQLGWWTLGMSFTSDGMVHYFVRPGVEDLRAEDHIASHYPYGFRNERLEMFFFNVCSVDNGRSWSTPWVIDDPSLYFVRTEAMKKATAQKSPGQKITK